MSVTLANAGSVDRSKTDFYPTPSNVTEALLRFLNIPKQLSIWEPAAGAGHMVSVMQEWGYKVEASDLHSFTMEDFLAISECRGDWIITNPPFSVAESFIRHALSFKPKGVAMLLKSQFWHSSGRLNLFREFTPKYVLPLTWRPDFLFGAKSGSPTMEVIWTVWDKDSNKKCEYIPLQKPSVQKELFDFNS